MSVNPTVFLIRGNAAQYTVGLSKSGEVGLVPADARPGDLMCMFCGASFPYILRSIDEQYVVVGEACKSLLSQYQTCVRHETSKLNDNLADLPAYAYSLRRPITDNLLVDFTLISVVADT